MTLVLPATHVQAMYPTGSRYICNPPVLDTDEDYFVLTAPHIDYDEWLRSLGYEPYSDDYAGVGDFTSYRLGSVNLIVTTDRDFYDRGVTATKLAKRFNLRDKQDRIDLFDAVRYGYFNDDLDEPE